MDNIFLNSKLAALKQDAEGQLEKGIKTEEKWLRRLNKGIDKLKIRIDIGTFISENKHKRGYSYYRQKHDIDNLFKLNVSRDWRLIYTIISNEEGERIAVILDLLPHKKYDKRFGYRTR